ncbi:carboxylesterase [Holotrichia oblita]|uniref:Carboxylesterase n=1 Tax=Holotrichia oblita TaxID=644536 RepID=A0ACB9T7D9_HOLOL|nr:carboxylesterase [Holotrichia oblita]
MGYITFILVLALFTHSNAQDLIVNIPQGALRGSIDIDRVGNEFYKFMNIPYGQPPLGNLRFRAPVAAEGWEGVREVNTEIPICFQCGYAGCPGSEDCLYLNVYTPEFPTANTTLKPVMVFIPGGGFTDGGPYEGAQHLITEDIVLVTISYRLGIFGSFSVDDPELGVPGNAAMKDQNLAIKWVHDNIKYFGGDSNNIMVFGDSAGAASVHLQVLSPMSKGLFHKALCESGVALFDLMNGVRNNGILVAQQLGIQTDNLPEMLNSLQQVSPWEIFTAQQTLTAEYPLISTPLVEMESNEPAFLSDEVITLIQTGNYNHMPFVIGHNNAEGLFRHIPIKQATGQNITITDFTDYIPPDLLIQPGSEEETIIANRIREFYYGDTEPSPTDIIQAIQLITDYTFAYPSYRAAVEHVRTAQYPVYFYYFSADTLLNIFKRTEEVAANFPGASHTDEKGYLFRYSNTPEIESGSVEEQALARLVTLWTNFAKYSTPTLENDEIAWEAITADTFNFLHFDTDRSTLKTGAPQPENMAFWKQLYDDFFPARK